MEPLSKVKFPPDPKSVIYWDIETRSYSDLRKKTGYNYAIDATTEIMCSVFIHCETIYIWWDFYDTVTQEDTDNMVLSITAMLEESPHYKKQNIIMVQGYEGLMDIAGLITPYPWVAHNGFGFDEKVWKRKFSGFMPPYVIDSMSLCRRVGLPAGLNALGKYLFKEGKHAGSKTLSMLSKPIKKGVNAGRFIPINWGALSSVIAYCVVDVLIMKRAIEEQVWPFCLQPSWEDSLYWLDKEINDKGFKINVDMSKKMIDVENKLREQTGESVEELVHDLIRETTDGKKVPLDKQSGRSFLRSTKRVHAWLEAKHDIVLDNLRKDTVTEFLAENEVHPDVELILLARIGESSITTSKVKRALFAAHHHDHRIRGALALYSAHTKRWGGRINQPQNMARGHIDLKLDECMENLGKDFNFIRKWVGGIPCSRDLSLYKNPNPPRVSDFLAIQVRSTIEAEEGLEFAIIDLKSVEARGVCYLADDKPGLEVYEKGLDPYKKLATKLFNVLYEEVKSAQRFIGKTGELGCGYGMGEEGAKKFLVGFGLDPDKLSSIGITPKKIVETYRDLHSALAGKWKEFPATEEREARKFRTGGLWRDLDYTIKKIASGSDGAVLYCGRCRFTRHKGHMFIQLPSGTRLIYRNVRMGRKTPPWGGEKVEVVFFDAYKNGRMVANSTYGGKISENLTQAFTRDILAYKMVEIRKKRSLVPSLHVHDEGLWEIKKGDMETFYALLRILSTPPPFCRDFPLAVEGFMSPIYRKKPSKKLGQKEFTAILGEVLGVDRD